MAVAGLQPQRPRAGRPSPGSMAGQCHRAPHAGVRAGPRGCKSGRDVPRRAWRRPPGAGQWPGSGARRAPRMTGPQPGSTGPCCDSGRAGGSGRRPASAVCQSHRAQWWREACGCVGTAPRPLMHREILAAVATLCYGGLMMSSPPLCRALEVSCGPSCNLVVSASCVRVAVRKKGDRGTGLSPRRYTKLQDWPGPMQTRIQRTPSRCTAAARKSTVSILNLPVMWLAQRAGKFRRGSRVFAARSMSSNSSAARRL